MYVKLNLCVKIKNYIRIIDIYRLSKFACIYLFVFVILLAFACIYAISHLKLILESKIFMRISLQKRDALYNITFLKTNNIAHLHGSVVHKNLLRSLIRSWQNRQVLIRW